MGERASMGCLGSSFVRKHVNIDIRPVRVYRDIIPEINTAIPIKIRWYTFNPFLQVVEAIQEPKGHGPPAL